MHLFLMNLSLSLSGFVVAFAIGWLYAVIIIVICPIMMVGFVLFVWYLQKQEKIQQQTFGELGSVSDQAFTNIKMIKSLCGEEHEIGKFSRIAEGVQKTMVRYSYILAFI